MFDVLATCIRHEEKWVRLGYVSKIGIWRNLFTSVWIKHVNVILVYEEMFGHISLVFEFWCLSFPLSFYLCLGLTFFIVFFLILYFVSPFLSSILSYMWITFFLWLSSYSYVFARALKLLTWLTCLLTS